MDTFTRVDPFTRMDPYTPLFHWVLEGTGSTSTALAYGIVWRLAQLRDGCCDAACGRMAGALGWTRQRLMRHLRVLCEGGYLVCRNPEDVGVTRRYIPLTRAQWRRRQALRRAA